MIILSITNLHVVLANPYKNNKTPIRRFVLYQFKRRTIYLLRLSRLLYILCDKYKWITRKTLLFIFVKRAFSKNEATQKRHAKNARGACSAKGGLGFFCFFLFCIGIRSTEFFCSFLSSFATCQDCKEKIKKLL